MATTQFNSAAERRDAALLGMWVFLATELMFFGPLFLGYLHGRIADYEAFVSGSRHMHLWLGTANTAILLTSSFTIALAVHKADSRKPLLLLTAALGAAFLGIKAFEYASEWHEAAAAAGGAALFYFVYFAMTGLHALHLIVGIGLVLWTVRQARAVELVGLYWHFVDIVWIFLYPMFYLLERYR